MARHELITRQTPFDVFAVYMQEMYLNTPRLDAFLTEKQSSFTKQDILNFFNQTIVRQTLDRYWEYERGEIWENRTASTAIWETIGHTFAYLSDEAGIIMESGPNENQSTEFQQMTEEQASIFRQKSVLAANYFKTVLLNR